MFKAMRDPDLYHAYMERINYFEGWYFKVVDRSGKHTIAFIIGKFIGNSSAESYCFIQVIDGIAAKSYHKKYPVDHFSVENDQFLVYVNGNQFSDKGLAINFESDHFHIKGTIDFFEQIKWKDSILNPGSMGFFNYLPFMECYSQVCVLHGKTLGMFQMNGEAIDFNGGSLYIEKNWGTRFPKEYLWLQCSNFKNRDTSFTLSAGHIPFLFTSFKGFLGNIVINNTHYLFTTMNRSKIQMKQNGTSWLVTLENKNHQLEVEVQYDEKSFVPLLGPEGNGMTPFVTESLTGNISLTLKESKTKHTIYADTGILCGVEFFGEMG